MARKEVLLLSPFLREGTEAPGKWSGWALRQQVRARARPVHVPAENGEALDIVYPK